MEGIMGWLGKSLVLGPGAALVLCLVAGGGAIAEEVDVALILAGDVSGSMTPGELHTERDGLAAALRDPAVMAAIHQGAIGRVAITYVEWAGPSEQWQIVPWTVIDDRQAAEAFAGILARAPVVSGNQTSLSAGLLSAARQFRTSGVTADRRVIDVSGDGPSNAGPSLAAARDAVVAEGITINGLPLSAPPQGGPYGYLTARRDRPEIGQYYEDCVIGGLGAFVMPLTDPAQFSVAMRRKLVLEIAARSSPVVPVAFAVAGGDGAACDDGGVAN
jgi:hypothetical protein